MFAAIAQLIQAEVPQDFSANAKKTATEGDATGGAFAELLALLQATPVVAPEADVESGVSLLDVPLEDVEEEALAILEGKDGPVEEVVSETTTEKPPGIEVPEVTTEASKSVVAASQISGATVQASDANETEADSLPDAPPTVTKPAKLTAVATATEAEVTVEEGVTVQPEKPAQKVSELAKPISAKVSEVAPDLAAAETPVGPVKAKSDIQPREAVVLPKLAEAKPTGPRVQVQQPEAEPIQEEVPVVVKAEAAVAKGSTPDAVAAASKQEAAEVIVTKAAPAAVLVDVETEAPDTPEAEVEGADTVDEAPPLRQRPSLFASLSRKDEMRMEMNGTKEAEALRLVDVHRGRPATMRAMLLMDNAEAPRVEAMATEPESVVKVESTAGVERASNVSRPEVAPRAEAPTQPEAPPARTTLPELAKTTLRGVRYLASNGERTITVKLVPESLGELRLDVVTKGEEVSIRMSSASPVVRDALEGQLAGLRDQLAKDGVDVKRIDVSSDMNGNGERSQQPSREAASETARAFARMARSMPHRGFAASEPAPTAYTPGKGFHRGDLNVFA